MKGEKMKNLVKKVKNDEYKPKPVVLKIFAVQRYMRG